MVLVLSLALEKHARNGICNHHTDTGGSLDPIQIQAFLRIIVVIQIASLDHGVIQLIPIRDGNSVTYLSAKFVVSINPEQLF